MRYTGAEAIDLAYHTEEFAPQVAPRTPFEVHEGSGLDARAREGVSPQFLKRAQQLVLIGIVIAIFFALRITIFSAAAAQLNANNALREQVNTAVQLERDLKVTTSTLSSSNRIDNIATQNYGMVRASDTEVLSLDGAPSYTVGSAVAESEAAEQNNADQGVQGSTNKNSMAAAELEEEQASGLQAGSSIVK